MNPEEYFISTLERIQDKIEQRIDFYKQKGEPEYRERIRGLQEALAFMMLYTEKYISQ
jgi:hypothetical protein